METYRTYIRTIDRETKEQRVYPCNNEKEAQIYDELEKESGFISDHIRQVKVVPDSRVVYPVVACYAPVNSGVDMYFLGVFSKEEDAKALVSQMKKEYGDDSNYTVYYTRAIID